MIPAIETVIVPPLRDLGDGFTVRRALPSVQRRTVGPFVFFDHLGPIALTGDQALDVRPHPHIGLATITHLIEGAIMHRDSLGSVQAIVPGAVNWMTAGRHRPFRTHACRIARRQKSGGARAAPRDPDVGRAANGLVAPVETASDMILAELTLAPGARYAFAPVHVERAIYIVLGTIRVAGQDGAFADGQLVVLKPAAEIVVSPMRPAAWISLPRLPTLANRCGALHHWGTIR